jgi:polysaccharide export outer membrane protein
MMRKMRRLFLQFIAIAVVAVALAGCATSKKVSYLQGMPQNYEQEIPTSYQIRIHPDDMLAIQVNSQNLELAQMFNLPVVGYNMSNAAAASGYISGQQRYQGYLVDKKGNIDFPQLGELHVEGKTRVELAEFIKNMLVNKGLLNDPIITVQFLNFKVSVLGEVNRPGTFDVATDRITIYEALAQAGDMTIYGKRDCVKVVREENGKRTVTTLDLRGSEILDSPYFYLQQNDIVYVEPNNARAGQADINQNRTVSTWVSAASMLVSVATLIISILK